MEGKRDRLEKLNDGREVIDKAVKLDRSNLDVTEKDFTDLVSSYLTVLELKKVLARIKQLHSLSKHVQELSFTQKDLLPTYTSLIELQKTVEQLKDINKIKVTEESF